MPRLRDFLRLPVIMLCLALSAPTGALAFTFTKFDPPGSVTGFSPTVATGINNHGEIVGVFRQNNAGTRAFLRNCAGFTTFDAPGADSNFGTHARGINNAGQIVGFSYHPNGVFGFLKSGGTFTTISVPGSLNTFAHGTNDGGQIVGWYEDSTTAALNHGFLKNGATYTTIDVPGADDTEAMGINDAGQIVGTFTENGFMNATDQHGFLKNGATFTTIDVPGGSFNAAMGINNLGQIVGIFSNSTGQHGYLKDGPTYTTIDVPGAFQTEATGINDAGQIVGTYRDATGFHGFVTGGFSDCTPPVITLSVTPAVLWPPNHKLVEIVVNVSAIDDPLPEIDLVSITSSEPSNGRGDGDTDVDIVVTNGRIYLRAERSGGSDRIYTITYRATDAAGNTSMASAIVTVPANQRK